MLKRFGAFAEDTIRVYTLHILLGLNFLHSANIVHRYSVRGLAVAPILAFMHHFNCRDIKGSNVLVDTDGCCKLADFGCSKSLSDIADASPSFKGTMRFMAPEVINGIDHGKPADVWALGCTIIEMLTARHPWAQFELPESAMYHVGSLKAMPPIPPHTSPEIHDFLQCCFSSEPLERWTVRPYFGCI
jgi:serine/threonine protein kinase